LHKLSGKEVYTETQLEVMRERQNISTTCLFDAGRTPSTKLGDSKTAPLYGNNQVRIKYKYTSNNQTRFTARHHGDESTRIKTQKNNDQNDV